MTLDSNEKYSAVQYAFDIHCQIARNPATRCTSLSLLRAITIIREYQSYSHRFLGFSNLHLAAAALAISIQLIEPRCYTFRIVEVVAFITKIDPEPLSRLCRLTMREIDIAKKDIVHYYTRDLEESGKDGLGQKQYMAQSLGIAVAMLVRVGKDPRENMIPHIKAFIEECSDVSSPRSQNIGSELRMQYGEPAKLLPVFLRYEDGDYESILTYDQGKLEAVFSKMYFYLS